MLTTNNKDFQIANIKNIPSNNIAINILNKNKLFGFVTFIKCLYNYRNKCISKNRDNNKPISSIIFIECLCSYGNKHINKNSKDSNLRNKVINTIFSTSIKYLVPYKTIYTIIKSKLGEKVEMHYNIITF